MTEQSAEIKDLATALLNFQANTHGVIKDSKNPAFKSKYASLEAVIETSRDGLQRAGIAFTQMPGAMVDNRLSVTTMLIHVESGQWLRTTMQIPLAKVDAQGAGSATTYACRYSLMAMLGLPPVDDDAIEASRPAPRQEPPRPQPQLVQANPADEADRRAYMALAKSAIANAEYANELTLWWKSQVGKRREYGIISGTAEFDELATLVDQTRNRLPADVTAAG